MLLKIRPHGPEEPPSHSCKAFAAMSYGPALLDYSKKYKAWNVQDTDDNDDTVINTEHMIGWVYADEIYWQIVCDRREAGNEV